MENLIFLAEKKARRIKARACTNGSTNHKYRNQEKAASPTTIIEFHLITIVIDAKQERNVMTDDIPNAFVQNQN
jgi:hypothetical protein